MNLSLKEIKYLGVILDDKLTWKAQEGTSKEGADGSIVVQCIYRQGLGTFTQNDTVAL